MDAEDFFTTDLALLHMRLISLVKQVGIELEHPG